MNALYIVLLVWGAQAAAFSVALTVWLIRIAATASPTALVVSASQPLHQLSNWEPAAPHSPFAVRAGQTDAVPVTDSHRRAA